MIKFKLYSKTSRSNIGNGWIEIKDDELGEDLEKVSDDVLSSYNLKWKKSKLHPSKVNITKDSSYIKDEKSLDKMRSSGKNSGPNSGLRELADTLISDKKKLESDVKKGYIYDDNPSTPWVTYTHMLKRMNTDDKLAYSKKSTSDYRLNYQVKKPIGENEVDINLTDFNEHKFKGEPYKNFSEGLSIYQSFKLAHSAIK